MGWHDETAMFAQLIDGMLLHVEVLHEREVGPVHRLGSDANLMRLAEKAIAVFVGGDIIFFFSTMRVDAHIVGDAIMVVAQGLIDAVDGLFFALASVGQAEKLARVAMEMVFLPLVRLHFLIRIVEVLAAERLRLLETIGGNREVDV